MRLFHHQNVRTPGGGGSGSCETQNHPLVPTPAPPPPPPFLTDEEEERSLCLLRESTTHLREGRQRLPTPDKVAIMELSSSFDKRRLGKQQQILSEITQRCREQEVTDLSSRITAKVLLKSAEDQQDSPAFLAAAAAAAAAAGAGATPGSLLPHHRRQQQRSGRRSPSAGSLTSTADLARENEAIERRLNFERGYKFFPARRIIRHPSRVPTFHTLTPTPGGGTRSGAEGGGGGGGGGVGGEGGYPGGREAGTAPHPVTRMMTSSDLDLEPPRAQTVDGPPTKGGAAGSSLNCLRTKLDAVPPLLLADLHGSPAAGGDSGSQQQQQQQQQQDRIGYYFSSSRLPLSQRSRTYFDSSRASGGRPFQSLATGATGVGSRNTGGRRHHQQAKAAGGRQAGRGLHNMLQQILHDLDTSRLQQTNKRGGGGGGGFGSSSLPLNLKSCAAAAPPVST